MGTFPLRRSVTYTRLAPPLAGFFFASGLTDSVGKKSLPSYGIFPLSSVRTARRLSSLITAHTRSFDQR
jgi:hypothetical protein